MASSVTWVQLVNVINSRFVSILPGAEATAAESSADKIVENIGAIDAQTT